MRMTRCAVLCAPVRFSRTADRSEVANDRKLAKQLPDVPLAIISGSDDPVGDTQGFTPSTSSTRTGVEDVTLTLVEGDATRF